MLWHLMPSRHAVPYFVCFSHHLLDLHETIVEIGVELCEPENSILLGLLRILPLTAQE
jgi:hypothetical protein